MIKYEETKLGFVYGAAKVERLCSDKKRGWILFGVESQKMDVQIYVTKTGTIRVFSKGGDVEWKKERAK